MHTDKKKKIGIILLIVGLVVFTPFIVSCINQDRNQDSTDKSILDNGVNSEKDLSSTESSERTAPVFDIEAPDEDPSDTSVEAEYDWEEIEKKEELKINPVDFTELRKNMTSDAFAGFCANADGADFPSDDISFTSIFQPMPSAINISLLAMCGVFYGFSNLDKTRVLSEGSRSPDNSLDALYQDVIVPYYKEGSYCVYRITPDRVTYVSGDEFLCLLLSDMPITPKQIAEYKATGETLEDLVSNGTISLERPVGDISTEMYQSVYEMCGIGYYPYFVETLGATEQLTVVHIVGDRVYAENYAVGGLICESYYFDDTAVSGESTMDGEEVDISDTEIEMVSAFTGYYCW